MKNSNKCEMPLTEAKELVEKYDLQGAIIIGITRNGNIEYHTWGENKTKCNILGKWMPQMFNASFTAIPFRTHFGWGNQGKPKPATPEELATLTKEAREWADQYLEEGYII